MDLIAATREEGGLVFLYPVPRNRLTHSLHMEITQFSRETTFIHNHYFHYFALLFLFFLLCLLFKYNNCLNQQKIQKLIRAPTNLGVDNVLYRMIHFGTPWWSYWILQARWHCRRRESGPSADMLVLS